MLTLHELNRPAVILTGHRPVRLSNESSELTLEPVEDGHDAYLRIMPIDVVVRLRKSGNRIKWTLWNDNKSKIEVVE